MGIEGVQQREDVGYSPNTLRVAGSLIESRRDVVSRIIAFPNRYLARHRSTNFLIENGRITIIRCWIYSRPGFCIIIISATIRPQPQDEISPGSKDIDLEKDMLLAELKRTVKLGQV